MTPKIESKEAFTIVGLKIRTKTELGEIPALWGQFMPYLSQIKHMTGSRESYG